ncbi:MAG: hypothetical protein BGO26_17635 [Actinobacteria bacterium 69-20]|nr:MAG: hypothetical protein BGO26_17635 [Actinobacteria bacterium 69-20]
MSPDAGTDVSADVGADVSPDGSAEPAFRWTSIAAVSAGAGTSLGGAARVLGSTARALLLDAAAAADTALRRPASAIPANRRSFTLPVRVLILSDENGRPLTTPDAVAPSLENADRALRTGASVRLRITGVDTIDEPAPAAALDPRSNRRLLLDDIRGHTAFLRRHLARRPALSVVGDPVTVVVVRTIAGRTTGCSLGMSADWVICQANLFDASSPRTYDETVLAHELGHALNLPHHHNRSNLMFPVSSPPDDVRGTALHPWQRAVLHVNRHLVPPS